MSYFHLLILLTSLVLSKSINYPISASNGLQIVSELNSFRSKVQPPAANMLKISYNMSFQAKLDLLSSIKGPAWFYKASDEPVIIKQGWNLFYVPALLNETSWTFGFLDTCPTYGVSCITNNFQYRETQKKCFNINNCNTTFFNNFRSCSENEIIPRPNLPCSYETTYWPKFIYAETKQLACIILNTRGPFAPKTQLYSYICYVNNVIGPDNDVPYQIGPSCSNCTKNAGCLNKLCL